MLYYFGYYKTEHIEKFYPSGSMNAISFKMGYVLRLLNRIGVPVNVISSYISVKKGFYPFLKVDVNDKQSISFLPSVKFDGIFSKVTGLFRILTAFFYLLFKIKQNDTVMVYHTPTYAKTILLLKKLKKFKMILEVEEVFCENEKLKNREKIKELEMKVFDEAESYIVVNDLIFDKYLNRDKKHMVLYGVYDNVFKETKRKDDGKIHILFSGSIDRVRGAFLAVETAKYLTEDYIMHMSGFGRDDELERILKKIEESNKENNCKIIMHGQLNENELDELALSCHVGLNLQDINNPFEAVSYPSKITFYMKNDLSVVSTKMSSVLASKLAENLYFTDMHPKAIAQTIKEMKITEFKSSKQVIKSLDSLAEKEMRLLINGESAD